MKELVFNLELTGKAAPLENRENALQARLSGSSHLGDVVFESQVFLKGETFDERGTIDFTGHGKLTFETVGAGCLTPSLLVGKQAGVVCWRIIKGEGEFTGATGYVTSNFVVSATGDVMDNQYIRIIVPG